MNSLGDLYTAIFETNKQNNYMDYESYKANSDHTMLQGIVDNEDLSNFPQSVLKVDFI